MGADETHSGSCLCGAVRYTVLGPLRESIACHCSQCRKTSGHYWSATRCLTCDLRLDESRGLAWFQSSPKARRGFCRECGASLFWEPIGGETMSIGTGTLNGATGLRTLCHIHVRTKGDYVEIEADVPQWPGDMP